MAVQDRATLKTYFETGDFPTQAQFSDLIDSMLNLSDDISANADGISSMTDVSTGALVANTPKTVTHNLDLATQSFIIRSEDNENNAFVKAIKPLTANSFQIESAITINAPGLTVQVIGTKS